MQGLLSYSDDEDEQLPQLSPRQPVASASSSASSSAGALRRPAAHPSSSSKLALKHQLPNLVRRPMTSGGAQTGPSGAGPSAAGAPPFSNSPLRRSFDPSPGTTPTRSPLAGDEADELEDDGELVRQLLRPPPLKDGEGWEDEYGLRRLGEEARMMSRQVDPALQHKVSTFIALKQQGTHFNDSLMKSRSFRNPTIYKKLVEFVDVDERRGLAPSIWGWEVGERERWTTKRISDMQKERSERLTASQEAGKRDRIGFTSSSVSSSRPPYSAKPKRPPVPAPPSAPTAAAVPSGGKAYSLIGVSGEDLVALGEKGGRDRDGNDGKRKREKTTGGEKYGR